MAVDLPARFTIEKAREAGPIRYLARHAGALAWFGPILSFSVFDSAAKAAAFRRHRMGRHAADAVVVRHTVH